jgi:hypothetical protein
MSLHEYVRTNLNFYDNAVKGPLALLVGTEKRSGDPLGAAPDVDVANETAAARVEGWPAGPALQSSRAWRCR